MNRVTLRTWTLVLLLVVNGLLALLFIAILLGGTLTDEFGRYVVQRHLYAPASVGLLVLMAPLLWGAVKLVIKPHLPDTKDQKKLFRATFDRMRKVARRWQLATGVIALLVILGGAQTWAVNRVCSPAPIAGTFGTAGIALSVDERLLFLAGDRNTVEVFGAAQSINTIGPDYRQLGTIQVGNTPQGLLRSVDGRSLYVVNAESETVSIIDLATYGSVKSLKVRTSPRWIAASPKGDRIYVSNVYWSRTEPRYGSISIIDANQQIVIDKEITGVNCPEGLAVSPDGTRLYVASQCGDGSDPLFVIDTATQNTLHVIPGLAVGNAVALSKDGRKAYVTRANFVWHDAITGKNGAPVSIIDTAANSIIKTHVLQNSAAGLALTPDGKYVLVTNGYQLSVIDAETDELVNHLSLRGYGNAIAVRSDGLVIVAVSDARRFVAFPMTKALSRWPCAAI